MRPRLCNGIRRSVFVLGLCALALPAAAQGRDAWQQPERVLEDLHLRPGMSLADVGCGTGYFTVPLARAVGDTGVVYAVDIDVQAVQTVARLAEQQQLLNVRALVSEPTRTHLEKASLDAAFICNVLHEVPPEQRLPLLKDTVRAIRPGGFLFLLDWRKSPEVTFDPYDKLIPRQDLLTLCTEAGLVLDAEFHYLRYQVFLRLRKPPAP